MLKACDMLMRDEELLNGVRISHMLPGSSAAAAALTCGVVLVLGACTT